MKIKKTFAGIICLLGIGLIIGSCSKDENNIILKDIDGNQYKTIKVGNTYWMAEDLKTTKFNDGSSISIVTDNTAWSNLTTSAVCDYNNDPNNSATYGKLYNWYAVNDSRKICPAGWHVPSEAEFSQFINALGGFDLAGGKLKAKGNTYWSEPNSGASNSSGFNAKGSGYRNYLGVFKDQSYITGYWSSTEQNQSAYLLSLRFDGSYADLYAVNKKSGFLLRCVKD